MKKILAFLLFIVVFGCTKDDDQESYKFRNNTDYNVIVRPFQNTLGDTPNFELHIGKGEFKDYKTEYMYGAFEVWSNETDRYFTYRIDGDTRTIYSTEAAVKYKVFGTAGSASITYANSNGGTVQRNVSLPFEIKFNTFPNGFKYISAQNSGEYGTVRVELYQEDHLTDSGFCDGRYCIATASN